MAQSPSLRSHHEHHFKDIESVRDVVIGMADGLTVPFALTAGLTGALGETHVIVVAGLAEIAAGAIAMGLGGYLATRSALEHYRGEYAREESEVLEKPEVERAELEEIFSRYGLSKIESAPLVGAISRDPQQWVKFMMRYELNLEEPDPGRAVSSARTIALSYVLGGLIPLSPYFFVDRAQRGLIVSALLTMVALLVLGGCKGRLTGTGTLKSAVQTWLIGSLAALAAFIIARAVGQS